ncbi:hypothetical protein [Flavobacterium piscis]|uniref:Uncharacterized protein n=1 Tax=Flavobacterium piscis TaxID=1114874 RepID=A0ABU1YBN3_9FLAO|nr:hypothetical protein [Flavobacterium piscis]MDR7211647.1 hypothetical protein [Flavobacterium piscis]
MQTSTTKPTTPGNWTDVMTKGPDCDDTNPYFTINCYTIGGSTQQQGSAYVPQANDKFAKPNIPTTIPAQILSTCASVGMEYLAKIFGKNTSREKFEQYYFDQFGVNITFEGVDYSKMTIFASNFFETTAFVGITQAIDAGNFLLTNLDAGNNTFHITPMAIIFIWIQFMEA